MLPSARRRRPDRFPVEVNLSYGVEKIFMKYIDQHIDFIASKRLTAKSLGTLSFTKLTYPVSPGHLPFLSTLYSSQLGLAAARADLAAKRGAGAKAAVKATRATKRRMTLANMLGFVLVNVNMDGDRIP